VGALNSAHIFGTYVPMEEPSTASGADIDRQISDVYFGFESRHGRGRGSGSLRSNTQNPMPMIADKSLFLNKVSLFLF
jgi:hypothetical protein